MYDLLFLYNVYSFRSVSTTHYRPLYNLDNLQIIHPQSNATLLFHILTSILPLLLSIPQCSAFLRSKFLALHRFNGKLITLCTLLSALPALKLSSSIHDNGPVENSVVCLLCVMWVIAMVNK